MKHHSTHSAAGCSSQARTAHCTTPAHLGAASAGAWRAACGTLLAAMRNPQDDPNDQAGHGESHKLSGEEPTAQTKTKPCTSRRAPPKRRGGPSLLIGQSLCMLSIRTSIRCYGFINNDWTEFLFVLDSYIHPVLRFCRQGRRHTSVIPPPVALFSDDGESAAESTAQNTADDAGFRLARDGKAN